MKFLPSLIGVIHSLTNDEIAAFGCRQGSYSQYHEGDGGTENDIAYQLNGFAGCHPGQARPCVRHQLKCQMNIAQDSRTLTITTNGIPDHNAWSLEPNAELRGLEVKFRVPKVPQLQSGQVKPVNDGAVGFAINGVDIYGGTSVDTCCDFITDYYDKIDYCTGYATPTQPAYGRYHYHFYPASVHGYQGCPVAQCGPDTASQLVGVAKDGFPIYGPVQWYSPSLNKIYSSNPGNNCRDCKLTQISSGMLDQCNGIEVADGSSSDGSNYRYIMTGQFPYTLQAAGIISNFI